MLAAHGVVAPLRPEGFWGLASSSLCYETLPSGDLPVELQKPIKDSQAPPQPLPCFSQSQALHFKAFIDRLSHLTYHILPSHPHIKAQNVSACFTKTQKQICSYSLFCHLPTDFQRSQQNFSKIIDCSIIIPN